MRSRPCPTHCLWSQEGGSLAFALAFACAIQLAMSGLFNIMLGLEDPFARRGGRGQLDSIHVAMLVEVARRQLLGKHPRTPVLLVICGYILTGRLLTAGLEADAATGWNVHVDPAAQM